MPAEWAALASQRKPIVLIAIGMIIAVFDAGCAVQPKEVPTIPASVVMDALKNELNHIRPQFYQVPGHGAKCAGPDGMVRIVSTPASATVSLKAITALAQSGSLGLAIPITAISGATIGPTLTATETTTNTQVVTFDVEIAGTLAGLGNEIKQAKTDEDTYAALIKDVPERKGDIQPKLVQATARRLTAEKQMADLIANQANQKYKPAPSPERPVPRITKLPDDLKIRDALEASEIQLLAIKHTALPCLKPQDIKVEVDFEVQEKFDVNPTLNLVIVKVSTDITKTNDATNSVVVTFDLTQGGGTTVLFR